MFNRILNRSLIRCLASPLNVSKILAPVILSLSNTSVAVGGTRTCYDHSNMHAKGHVAIAETWEEIDQRFIDFFNREDIDGWELRSGMLSNMLKIIIYLP